MTALELMRLFLSEEGYRSEEHDLSITFRHESRSYIYNKNREDGFLFQLVMWYNHPDLAEDPALTLKAVNAANNETAVVKLIFDESDNTMCASWEMLVDPNDDPKSHFPRIEHALSILPYAASLVFNKLSIK